MTIIEKLQAAVSGPITEVTITGQNDHYWLVSYKLAGITCTAELVR